MEDTVFKVLNDLALSRLPLLPPTHCAPGTQLGSPMCHILFVVLCTLPLMRLNFPNYHFFTLRISGQTSDSQALWAVRHWWKSEVNRHSFRKLHPPPKEKIFHTLYFTTVKISFTEYKNNLYKRWHFPVKVNMQIKQKINFNSLRTEFQWEGFCLVWIRSWHCDAVWDGYMQCHLYLPFHSDFSF